MNADIGTIPESELDLLNCAVRICEPTEKEGQGVLVSFDHCWIVNVKDHLYRLIHRKTCSFTAVLPTTFDFRPSV